MNWTRKSRLAAILALFATSAVAGTAPGQPRAIAASVDICAAPSSSQNTLSCKPGNDPSLHPLPALRGRHAQQIDYQLLRDGHVPAASATSTDPLLQAVRARDTLPTSGATWTTQGPAPITYPNDPYTDTGRVLALQYQSATGALFLGSAGGGIWKTTNLGTTWTPLTDSMPSLAIGALALDPNHPQTIYAGTGESAYCIDCLYGVGIYKSVDGGATWTLYGNSVFRRNVVSSIVVDPANSSRVYAGVVNRAGGNLGVAISTDGGQTWTDPAGTALTGHNVTDLAIDSVGDVYAAVSGSGTSNGIYVSSDGGLIWNMVSVGLPSSLSDQLKLALAPNTAGKPRSSQVLYTVIGDSRQATFGKLLGVYRSTNGGGSWTQIATPSVAEPFEGQAWYDLYIAVDPRDLTGNTVYFGLSAVYRTTNGLAGVPTWTDLTCNIPGCNSVVNMHPDQHAVAFAGTNVFYGNDGGVYGSASGGNPPFTPKNATLALTQFYGGALGAGPSASRILGGSQDNGTTQTDGTGWLTVRGGDGMQTAIDPNQSQNMYGEWPGGNMFATHDGSTWNQQTNGLDMNEQAQWSAPLVMDPNSPQTLYTARMHLYRSVDGENSWTNISASVTPGTAISAIAVAKSDPSTIYMGDMDGHTWATHDGGASWSSLDGTACAPADASPFYCSVGGITSMAVDPSNSQVLYATANGFAGTQHYHVFKTTDGGVTWTDISSVLPDIPFQSVTVNPAQPAVIYAAADIGVYVSPDGGASWSVLGTGLPNASVYQVVPAADGSSLVAFTHGRGAWRIQLSVGATPAQVTGVGATPGNNQASVTWKTPSDGGSPLLGFTVDCEPGAHQPATLISGLATSAVVPNLANGTPYSCTVAGFNANGAGPTSGPVNVTPSGTNSLPTISVAGQTTAAYGGQLSMAVTVSDMDGDALTTTATGLPNGFRVATAGSGATRTITVTGSGKSAAVTQQPGAYALLVSVSDGVNSPVSQSIPVSVTKQLAGITPGPTAPFTRTNLQGIAVPTATSLASNLTYTASLRETWFGSTVGNLLGINTPVRLSASRMAGSGGNPGAYAANANCTVTAGRTFPPGPYTLAVRCANLSLPVGVYDIQLAIADTSPYFQGSYDTALTVYDSGPLTNPWKEYGYGTVNRTQAGISGQISGTFGIEASACISAGTSNPGGGAVYVEHRSVTSGTMTSLNREDIVVESTALTTCLVLGTNIKTGAIIGSAFRSDSANPGDPYILQLSTTGGFSPRFGISVFAGVDTQVTNDTPTDIAYSTTPLALNTVPAGRISLS